MGIVMNGVAEFSHFFYCVALRRGSMPQKRLWARRIGQDRSSLPD